MAIHCKKAWQQIDHHTGEVGQSLLLEVKKITSDFLPGTASMLEETLEHVQNDIREEHKNCGDKFLEVKEAYASLLELGKHVKGQGEGQEADDLRQQQWARWARPTSLPRQASTPC